MRVIYVAGKYRADENGEGLYDNIICAEVAARMLWKEGWATICPHLNSAFFGGDDNIYLVGYLEILRRCDAIYMLKGWQDSVGARQELELAIELNKEVIYEEENIG